MSVAIRDLALPALIVLVAFQALRHRDWRSPAVQRAVLAAGLGALLAYVAAGQIDRARAAGDSASLTAGRLLLIGGLAIVLWAALRWFFADATQPVYLQQADVMKETAARLERGYPATPAGAREHLADLEYFRNRLALFPGKGPERDAALRKIDGQIEELRQTIAKVSGA